MFSTLWNKNALFVQVLLWKTRQAWSVAPVRSCRRRAGNRNCIIRRPLSTWRTRAGRAWRSPGVVHPVIKSLGPPKRVTVVELEEVDSATRVAMRTCMNFEVWVASEDGNDLVDRRTVIVERASFQIAGFCEIKSRSFFLYRLKQPFLSVLVSLRTQDAIYATMSVCWAVAKAKQGSYAILKMNFKTFSRHFSDFFQTQHFRITYPGQI